MLRKKIFKFIIFLCFYVASDVKKIFNSIIFLCFYVASEVMKSFKIRIFLFPLKIYVEPWSINRAS